MNREVIEIALDEIIVKTRHRTDDGDLGTLENSIRRLGLLVPLVVDRNNVLISGGRRLRACRLAGLGRVHVIRVDTAFDSLTALDIQVDMNLCRKPLTNDEIAQLIRKKKAMIAGRRGGALLSGIARLFSRDK